MQRDLEQQLFNSDAETIAGSLKALKEELNEELLLKVVCLKMFHSDPKVRKAAKAVLLEHAPPALAEAVKKDRRNYTAISNGKKLLKVIDEQVSTFGFDQEAFARTLLRIKTLDPGFGSEIGEMTDVVLQATLAVVADPRPLLRLLSHAENITLSVKNSLPAGMSELASMKTLFLEGRLKKGDHIEELISLPNQLTLRYFVAKADISLLLPIKDKIIGLYFNGGFSDLSDISALEGFSALETLDLSNTGVTDLSPLAGKPLKWLNLRELKATDYEALRALRELKHLYLTRNQMASPEVIGELSELESLSISHVEGFNIRWLKRLPKLKHIEFWGYKFDDISALRETSAERVSFIHCGVADLSPLAEIPTLKAVTLNTASVQGDFTIDELKQARPELAVL